MFNTKETSRDEGKPITLVRFSYGSGPHAVVLRYTDAEKPILYSDGEYEPIPINRGTIVQSGTLDKSAVEFTVPTSSAISQLYLAGAPSSVVLVTIRQGHTDDGDKEFPVSWVGRINVVIRDPDKTKIQCEPFQTALKRAGLRRNYQATCPHALFSSGCGASKAAVTVDVVPDGIGNSGLTLPSGWNGSLAIEKYLGGMLSYTGLIGVEYLSIIAVTETWCKTNRNIIGLTAGATVQITAGCDKMMATCRDVHDNILNYGGQPWIPVENPFGYTNIYY